LFQQRETNPPLGKIKIMKAIELKSILGSDTFYDMVKWYMNNSDHKINTISGASNRIELDVEIL